MASLRSTEEGENLLRNRELSQLEAGGREGGSDACFDLYGVPRRRKRSYLGKGPAMLFPQK